MHQCSFICLTQSTFPTSIVKISQCPCVFERWRERESEQIEGELKYCLINNCADYFVLLSSHSFVIAATWQKVKFLFAAIKQSAAVVCESMTLWNQPIFQFSCLLSVLLHFSFRWRQTMTAFISNNHKKLWISNDLIFRINIKIATKNNDPRSVSFDLTLKDIYQNLESHKNKVLKVTVCPNILQLSKVFINKQTQIPFEE